MGSAEVMGIGQDDAGSPPSADPPLSSDTPDPWWQRIEFNPALGTPAGLEWQDSAYLDAEDLSGLLSQDEFAQFEASGLAFELRLDADRDGTTELYQVGVYRTAQDDAGTFVSVRQDGTLLKVFPDEGRAGFSALTAAGDGVHWHRCLGCGVYRRIGFSDGEITIR
ncbi:MAG: hypothetical protein O7A03_13030 [Alphaproteobacteria bacterium]|nr:hypothetical protein [Alphaproteobacteria bacterium]